MLLREQPSFISGVHSSARRNQTRKGQSQNYQRGSNTKGRQICPIIFQLCNFFCNHIPDFAIIAALLFKLTRQYRGYISGPLPNAACKAFTQLQCQLSAEPMLAFPWAKRNYALITNATCATTKVPGGLSATLIQTDMNGQVHIISHTSQQLKENEKNYSPFQLETTAAEWGMDTSMNTWKDPSLHSMPKSSPLSQWGANKTKLSTDYKQPFWNIASSPWIDKLGVTKSLQETTKHTNFISPGAGHKIKSSNAGQDRPYRTGTQNIRTQP